MHHSGTAGLGNKMLASRTGHAALPIAIASALSIACSGGSAVGTDTSPDTGPCRSGVLTSCPHVTVTYNAGTNTTTIQLSSSDNYTSYSAQISFIGVPTVGTHTESDATADGDVTSSLVLNAAGQPSHWTNVAPNSSRIVNNPFVLTLSSVTPSGGTYAIRGQFSTTLYGAVPTTGSSPDNFSF